MLNNYSCISPLETSSAFLKSGRINKPHVGRLQLDWELHYRRCCGNFLNCLAQHPQLFLWQIYASITIKSNQFAGKTYSPSEKKKKKKKKNEQVLLYLEKILENETMGEVPCWRPAPHPLYHYFQSILLFWWSIFDGTNIHITAIYRRTFM